MGATMDVMVPSPIIDAALVVLADGKARSADDVLAEAEKRGLLGAGVTRKHVYTALSEYIIRAVGSGRRPEITEDVEDRFRINRAPDDWRAMLAYVHDVVCYAGPVANVRSSLAASRFSHELLRTIVIWQSCR